MYLGSTTGTQLDGTPQATISIVQLFSNPHAGWIARRRVAALRRRFMVEGITVLNGDHGSKPLMIDRRAQHICCAGGDGTLRHVLAALIESGREISVSVYPNGTVNLVAREIGYSIAPAAFVQRVLKGDHRGYHHVGLIGDVPMASCASVGPDSYAVAAVSLALKRLIGRAAYIVAVCGFLIRWPRVKITLKNAERELVCEAVYVAKGRYFAGSWSLAPTACMRSQTFEVIALQNASRRTFFRLCWSMLRRLPVGEIPGVEQFNCTELEITSEEPAPLQSDGDIVGYLPLRLALRLAPIEFS
ncbi:diacylglycerol kinase family protein [Sphingomonas sp. CARO-RG-8B-R24-01]|uniref:diacylglycerol/lipid kinase family protein n=1 Tax=Sphingomonas sp. CARO-RG-8B-R24-01 TaxID=2914831 RepID=UPI001F5A7688|nr:diacylglycerol kinase family protein [Sphingomonas sp. CARO-RG-8B-R24-01]